MFIVTTSFSRKKFLQVLLGILTIAILLLCFLPQSEEAETAPTLKTNAERLSYIHSLGWEVDPEPTETLQLQLPETLPANYIAYNQIQLAQGFDLSAYCGKQLIRYTYHINNYPNYPKGVQLNLYICDDHIAAGDIIATGSNGFQAGILYPGQTDSNL